MSARNAGIYGVYALTVLVVQLALLAALNEERVLPLLAPMCLVVLPAFAWTAGWLTIGIASRAAPSGTPPGATQPQRNPRLGALICLTPNLLLCAGLGVLFLAR